jgi:hypothetical protein
MWGRIGPILCPGETRRAGSGQTGAMTSRPDDDLRRVRSAHARLLETVGGIDDATARRPSLLPGWDVAMLVTHLARNADGHTTVAEGARAGERRRRYPGREARDAGIEAGRGGRADEVADDLRASIDRLEQAWDTLPPGAWAPRPSPIGCRRLCSSHRHRAQLDDRRGGRRRRRRTAPYRGPLPGPADLVDRPMPRRVPGARALGLVSSSF